MKRIAILIVLVAGASFLANGAIGQNQDLEGTRYQAVDVQVDTARITQAVAFKPPPIHLPNIAALVKKLEQSDRTTAARQYVASEKTLAFWNNKGRWLRAPRHDRCAEVPWQRSCTVARASYRLHSKLAAVAEYRLIHELPNINDWRTAVHFVQKIYPGTESWLLAISAREGGWGQWVWYGGRPWTGYHIGNDFLGADTVGGQLQFRYSTFAPYWRHTQDDLKNRGFIIPEFKMPPAGGDPKYAAWLSPLGQALTGAYMRYTGQDACHWCLG